MVLWGTSPYFLKRLTPHHYLFFNVQEILFLLVGTKKYPGMDEATIEDLAFPKRSTRELDGVERRVCLSGASYAAAEKSDEGMALKI